MAHGDGRGGHKVENAMWEPGSKRAVAKLPGLGLLPTASDSCVPALSPCGACEGCGRRAASRVCAEAIRGAWDIDQETIEVGTMAKPDETVTYAGLVDVLQMLGIVPTPEAEPEDNRPTKEELLARLGRRADNVKVAMEAELVMLDEKAEAADTNSPPTSANVGNVTHVAKDLT